MRRETIEYGLRLRGDELRGKQPSIDHPDWNQRLDIGGLEVH